MPKLKQNNVEKYLRSFAKSVLRQAKQILKKKNKVVSGKLLDSLKYRLEATKEGYNLIFKGDKHAKFIDKGVSGTKTTRTYQNIFGKRERSPFKYTNKQPPASALDKWIVRKGIAPRDKQGKFVSRQSLNFLIARSIKNKGIRATLFFTKPFERGLDLYGDEIVAGYLEDKLDLQ